jgi:hypothetical protein
MTTKRRTLKLVTVWTFIADGVVVFQTANEQEAAEAAYTSHQGASIHKGRIDINNASYVASWKVGAK